MAQRKQALEEMPLWPPTRRSTTGIPRTSGSALPGRTPRTRPTPIAPRGVGTHTHPATTIGWWAQRPAGAARRAGQCRRRAGPARCLCRRSARRVRDGLLAHLALTEAAGFLAHRHAWVHPLDLALREAGLTAPVALAALGAGARALPHTLAQPAGRLGWDDPPLDTLPAADQGIADALDLARLLRRLPGGGPHPFGSAAATADALAALGVALDPDRLAGWWAAHAPAPAPRRRFGARRGEGRVPYPPLLAGAMAAASWMDSGLTDPADPAHALLAAFGRLVRQSPARHVFVPLWSAYPASGFGGRDALPTLRSDAADRVAGWGGRVTWPIAGLRARAGRGARFRRSGADPEQPKKNAATHVVLPVKTNG